MNYNYSVTRLIIGMIDPNTKEICKHNGNVLDFDRDILVEGEFE